VTVHTHSIGAEAAELCHEVKLMCLTPCSAASPMHYSDLMAVVIVRSRAPDVPGESIAHGRISNSSLVLRLSIRRVDGVPKWFKLVYPITMTRTTLYETLFSYVHSRLMIILLVEHPSPK